MRTTAQGNHKLIFIEIVFVALVLGNPLPQKTSAATTPNISTESELEFLKIPCNLNLKKYPKIVKRVYQKYCAKRALRSVSESIGKPENLPKLYNLMSTEIKQTFGEAAWQKAVGSSSVKIIAITENKSLKINGDFAEQDVVVQTEDGQSLPFRIVLRMEDNEWKLFGTIAL